MWRIAFGIALAMFLTSVASSAEAEPRLYYCWAPDPVTGKVFVSETRPVGPIAERGGYGARYSAWLKATGKVAGDIQAYCAMRESEEAIARARAALTVETCRECGSARDFVDAPMGGPLASRAPTALAKPAAPTQLRQYTSSQPTDHRSAAHDGVPWIVVLGNVVLGRTVWSQGGADVKQRVDAMAQKIASSGWITLVSARTSGAGAAMCVKDANRIRFFVIFPRATYKIALREAQTEANNFAGRVGQTSFLCGAWMANDRSGSPASKGLLDYLKDGLYERVGEDCDERLPPVIIDGDALLRGGKENPRADHGTVGPCRIRKLGSMGARG